MKFLQPIIYIIGFVFMVWFVDSFKSTCSDFHLSSVILRKDTAQAAFDKEPMKWKNLDRDNDGIACE